jgi:hypoxanthine phosphoribosyltransferase
MDQELGDHQAVEEGSQMEGIKEILVSEQEISQKVKEMAARIAEDTPDGELILLGVLKGAVHFLSDLSRALPPSAQHRIDFLQVSSYGAATKSSGVVQFKRDHDLDIQGKHVVVVEDIVDSGLTLEYVLGVLKQRNPASLRTAALLIKPDALEREVQVDYIGFEIPNKFVVGYGLDFDERYRGLAFIAVLQPPT